MTQIGKENTTFALKYTDNLVDIFPYVTYNANNLFALHYIHDEYEINSTN